jgi:RNA-binding protein
MIGGQGLTENVIEETNRALNDHELIKVKLQVKIVKFVHKSLMSLLKQQVLKLFRKLVKLFYFTKKQNKIQIYPIWFVTLI